MMNANQVDHHLRLSPEKFDQQWVNLMLEAREIGLTPDEVREFLKVGAISETHQ